MISVAEAFTAVLAHRLTLPEEACPLSSAAGRILKAPLTADRDLPPFDRVMMDGIAIQFDQFATGQRRFSVAGMQRAGQPQGTLTDASACLEVMTGTVLPGGTDTVVRYEDVQLDKGWAEVLVDSLKPGQNIHRKATDGIAGQELVPVGTRLGPAEIAVAASVGQATVSVSALPRIALISTGDELVDIPETPLSHQIRRSNTYLLQAALQAVGAQVRLFHLPDEVVTMKTALRSLLTEYDALVLSGGVSAGKADFVPAVMSQLGVKQVFHQVAQRPGKPLWFGASDAGKVVFGLPGNPVSTFLCAYRYLLPWLKASLGVSIPSPRFVRLSEAITFLPKITYFLPVSVSSDETGIAWAKPLPGSSSADYANLLHCDGFLEIPADRSEFDAGEAFPIWEFR